MTSERAIERRVVSVLFADLVGFTALSEQLDAEDVTLVQDAYFEAVRETINRHGGQLEKFVGDAAMAVFGAPRVRDDDAERAVRAGLALVAAVQRVGAGFALEPGALRVRVGVASGETVYGEASAERGPVTGDVVNTAARLQAAGDPETVTIGETTALAVADAVELERLPPFDLKGKSEPVPAWRAVSIHSERSRERALGRLRAPTLGRDDEVSHLGSLLGSTGRITVIAPPGVGKTRLLEELAAAAVDSVVLRARLRPDVLSPFEPVGQLVGAEPDLEALARAAGASEARAAVVAELLGSVAAAEGARPAAEREQLFAAWLEGLDAVAGRRAALWLVEDVHWASPDLLAFLDLAGSSPRSAGRLVVASARPVLLDDHPAWVDGGERLDLPLLPTRETEALVRELVGDALPPALVDRIAERSAGNPLFIEELLRTWAGAGILAAGDTGWRLVAPVADVELPLTVQAIYAAQLDDLPPPARAVARRAAVAGRRFPRAALAVLEAEDPEAALDTLVRRALISGAEEDVLLGPSHSYRHALLRDAGYASLARAERASLHVRLADWLAERPESSRPALAEVIGRHYAAALEATPALAREVRGRTRGEIQTQAAAWFETAARVALGFAAWESARDLAARALELTAESDALDRARRLQLLGEATAAAVGVDEALPLLEESLAAYRGAGAGAARWGIVDAACSLGRLRLRATTEFTVVEQLADELLVELGEREDLPTARLLALRGASVLSAWDDFDRARGDAERSLGLARSAGDPDAELEALQLLTNCIEEDDEPARQRWAEIESLARARGRWDLVIGAQRSQALIDGLDEPGRMLSGLKPAAELAEARGLNDQAAWIDYDRTEAHLAAGSWDDALAACFRAVGVAEARALPRLAVRTWFAVRPIALARGRTDLIERAFPVFEGMRGTTTSPYALVVVGAMELAFAEAGLIPPFVPEFEPRLASFDLGYGEPSWMAAVEAVIVSWIEAGDLAGVRVALDRLGAAVEGKSVSQLARASQALMWSWLLLAEGDAPAAAIQARQALDTKAPWWRSRGLRAMEAAGAATPEAIAEAAALERSLGIEPAS